MVNPIPDGYPRVSASLAIDGAADAIDFYTSVLGFTERMRMQGPPGKVAHAELTLGDSLVMVADEFPEMGFRGPGAYGGTPIVMNVYVDDVDATFAAAIGAGAKEVTPPTDQFYGDRSARIEDRWGHHWGIATHIEDVAPDEMERRMAEMG